MSYSDLMGASTSSSFVISDMTRSSASDRDDDVDSLPSISSSILDSEDDDDRLSDAQREWEASLEQLQLLLTMIVMPFAGKFLGRKFAYWSRCSSFGFFFFGKGCVLTVFVLQAGRATWNGCTTSRSGGRISGCLTLPVR